MITIDEFGNLALPCGSTAYFDHESGISHRCMDCSAVVGSIGMPRSCKELFDNEVKKEQMWKALSE